MHHARLVSKVSPRGSFLGSFLIQLATDAWRTGKIWMAREVDALQNYERDVNMCWMVNLYGKSTVSSLMLQFVSPISYQN